jgi:hypothetical protein
VYTLISSSYSLHFAIFFMNSIPDFLIPIGIWAAIQWIKMIIDIATTKTIRWSYLRWAWWFPSVHSGIAASITTLVAMRYWLYGAEFAIAFSFSFLFWYDAANVRFEAGQHASFLNRMSEELDGILDFWWKFVLLKERLWHTAFEVAAGVIVWVSLTLLYLVVIEWPLNMIVWSLS